MRIHALQTGRVEESSDRNSSGRAMAWPDARRPLFDKNWSDWLPTYAFAIEHPEGVVVVNSGANAGLMNLPQWHPYFRLAVHFDDRARTGSRPTTGRARDRPARRQDDRADPYAFDHDAGLEGFSRQPACWSAPASCEAASGFAGQAARISAAALAERVRS